MDDAARALDTLIERAPAKLRPLFRQSDPKLRLDDARIESIEAIGPSSIAMDFVQGELATGYGLLTVTFKDATLIGLSLDEGRELASRPRTEIWYFEFDEHGDGTRSRFEARFLLWPHGEFGVRFSDATWTWKPRMRRTVYRRRRT